MRFPVQLSLVVAILLATSACLGPRDSYIEEASDQGIYAQSIDEILDQDLPVSNDDPRSFDLSGVYVSEITSDNTNYFKRGDRELILRIRQNGNQITAFDSTYNMKIEGEIKNNIVHFYAYPSLPTWGNSVSGIWAIDAESGFLRGKWRADSHPGKGRWDLRKLKDHGVELYTTDRGLGQYYAIDEMDRLLDDIFASDEHNVVFYLHGRGDEFEEDLGDSGIPVIEEYSNTRFVFVRWLSWKDTSVRPYKHAIASSRGLSELLFALDEYKLRNPEAVGDRSITLLAHSMGNIPLQGFLEYLYEKRDLKQGLFDTVILSSADLPVEGHRAWLEKCDFADEIYVIQHRGDLVLYLSEWFFTNEFERDGLRLGTGFGPDDDIPDLELAANAKYLDLTRLSLVNHKHFRSSEAAPLFRILLNGGKLEFPNPEIGLYRRSESRPVYYFFRRDPDLEQNSSDRQ